MKNNLEFFNYYKGSHVKYRDRVENRKYRIENALRDLMTLGLIRIGGTGKARKVNTDIDMYEYTKGGQLCAWLIKSLDDKQRQNANNEIYDCFLMCLRQERIPLPSLFQDISRDVKINGFLINSLNTSVTLFIWKMLMNSKVRLTTRNSEHDAL